MITELFYFTGTGGSLHVANRLKEKLSNATIHSMQSAMKMAHQPTEASVIGLVFPTYYLTMPEFVKAFVEQLKVPTDAYVFMVAISGGTPGNVAAHLSQLLEGKGRTLHSAFSIPLGENSIVLKNDEKVLQKRVDDTDRILNIIRQVVMDRGEHFDIPKRTRMGKTIYGQFTKIYMRNLSRIDLQLADQSKCNQCGICEKLCPADNIMVTKDGVTFHEHCAECFACIQGCPQNAIRFGRVRRKDGVSYRHPEVSLADIIKGNEH